MQRRFIRIAVLGALSVLTSGIAGCQHRSDFERELDRVDMKIASAFHAGAYVCAPRELAVARAHLDFARVELEQGDTDSSQAHMRDAALHASAAERLSPDARCASAGAVAGKEVPLRVGADEDLDGVPDKRDACPNESEDSDGYLDSDGCPDPDNDQDGVPDTLDKCPNQRDETRNVGPDGCALHDPDGDGVAGNLDRCPDVRGVPANQGCPRLKYPGVEVLTNELRLADPILFDDGLAVIRSVSLPILKTVAEVLGEHPGITLELAAHTDSQGDDRQNLALSQARADSVRRYLIDAGIDASRLTARGYGEERPIESNRTSQGRAINRRVEFNRVDKTP